MQGRRAGQVFFTLIDGKQETLLQLYQHDGCWSGRQHGGTRLWETIELACERWHSLDRPGLHTYEVIWDEQQGRFALRLHQGELVFLL